jgi:crotonobetainyl-CoA:carnitine CoA-transferase CaiB-like acyl-CoA transferase
MARTADVLVESFRPGVLDKLGLSYASLAKENPRLVLCSLSGWGVTGPLREKAGHDLGYTARSGVLGYGGSPEAPAMPGAQIADIGGALCAATAILAALQERARTGKGRAVDVSLFDSSLPFLHMHLGARLAQGEQGAPLSRGRDVLNGGYPCYRLYRTRDGRHLAVAALEPKFWQGFCRAVGREDLSDEGWKTGEEGARIKAQVAEVVAARTLAEWEAFLADKDLCIEPVREGDEILADPLLTERGMLFDVDDPREGRPVRQLKTPLHGMGEPPHRPVPALGEHTRQALAEAGLSAAEIDSLIASGAAAVG